MKTFFEQVYDIIEKIPIGTVVTYGDIAKMLGRPRGSAIGVKFAAYASASRKPDDFPWHRVVFLNGRIPDTELGKMQRDRLIKDGVGFTENGLVDVEKYRWKSAGITNYIPEENTVLVNKIHSAINEFQKNLEALNAEYDMRKAYMEIDALIKELKHPTPEMLNFIGQVRNQIEQKIHNSIALFQQKVQSQGYNDQKEYVQICLFIKQLKDPTQEMLDFVDEQILEKYIENKIKEFNSNLYKLSNSFDFSKEYTDICNLINKTNGHATWMLDFMRVDIAQIIKQQEKRTKLPHRFFSRKYIPSRKWDEWGAKYTKAVDFSRKLIDYKNYSLLQIPHQKAFDEINQVFFKQLTDIIQKIREAFGYDINIVLCACPSSSPDKKNTVQLSITEYVKRYKSVFDGNDLFIKVQKTEPQHLSQERNFDTIKSSIRLNEQKYAKEFFNKRNVFVICDDVYTTGTTVKACSWYLEPKQVIENSIFVYTIAETVEIKW